MSIWFLYHKSLSQHKVKQYKIKKGDPILKIFFDDKDIHTSHWGDQHLDIWGSKLKSLISALNKGPSRVKIGKEK